jgi:hypothetical protein
MTKTTLARDYLKSIFNPEFHNYIDTKLAGDFAYELSQKMRILDTAATQERLRCLSKCRMVMDYHSDKSEQESDDESKNFREGEACGAEDCIEAIEGKWDYLK